MPGSNITAIELKVWGMGDPELTAGRWKIVSPALSADKIRIPVLFQLPEQEAREIPELYARLYREGTPTELYAFPDEDHLKIEPRHLAAVFERISTGSNIGSKMFEILTLQRLNNIADGMRSEHGGTLEKMPAPRANPKLKRHHLANSKLNLIRHPELSGQGRPDGLGFDNSKTERALLFRAALPFRNGALKKSDKTCFAGFLSAYVLSPNLEGCL